MKLSPMELIDQLFDLQQEYRIVNIGIEETIYLQAIKPFLDEEQRKRNRFLRITPLKHNQVQKETRIRGLIPRYESYSIFHIKGHCEDLEEEQIQFPKGLHDDVLDAEAYQMQIAKQPNLNKSTGIYKGNISL
jgi:phage terminase large subunit-like protein